jgi:multiple sugar transport system ATP-binding protein
MAGIEIKNVTKKYGKDLIVIEGLNLTIRDGEFFCLLGPSGCGKSTTLRMIAGLEEISGGTVKIGERIVNDIPPEGRNIAMVFETYALYPHLSVYENIAFCLKIRKIPSSEIRRKVERVAAILEMEDFLSSKVSNLGDGQKQRVSVCRALVRDPEVFLMDEPISHLDATLRAQMRAEIKRLQRKNGATYVYVTHDQVEAMALADRIAIMKNGVIQQIGTPTEVFTAPANKFVGGFIGEPPMNFWECKIERDNGELYLISPIGSLAISPQAKKAIEKIDVPGGVLVGVRPTDIRVFAEDAGINAHRAKIDIIEPRGDNLILNAKIGDEIVTVDPPAQDLLGLNLHRGDTIWLRPEMDQIHFFDKSTETTLV